MQPRAIYAVDVGSTRPQKDGKPAFAWARISPGEDPTRVIGSDSIRALVEKIDVDANDEKSIALGFEAPLFLPVPSEAKRLSSSRKGEGNRSFAAPVGGYVTTLGLHQAAWILRELRKRCPRSLQFKVDMDAWPPSGGKQILFCWEAFVSGKAHRGHLEDAATAAAHFFKHEANLKKANAVTADFPLSLIGAAALWSGWSSDLALLGEPTLVLKPLKSLCDSGDLTICRLFE